MTEVMGADGAPGLAAAIGAVPGLADRLLAEHVPDPDGRCRLCPIGAQAGWHRWPCRIHVYAAAARATVPSSAGPLTTDRHAAQPVQRRSR